VTPLTTAAVDPTTTLVAHDFTDFRTAVSQSFVPLRVTSEHSDHFRGRIRSCGADDVQVTEVTASAHLVERTPELIARADRHYYKLSLILAGTALLVQDNREAMLRPGDVALYDTHRPYSLAFEEDFRTLVVMFPQRLIDLPRDLVGQLTAVRMSGKRGMGNVVVPFLAQLGTNLDQLGGPAGVRLAHTAVDLLATLFATELDLARSTAGPHHELMRRVLAYIDANLLHRPRPGADRRRAVHLHPAPAGAVPRAGHHCLGLDPHPAAGTLPPRTARPGALRAAGGRHRGEVGFRRRAALQPGVQDRVRPLAERTAPGLTVSDRFLPPSA
jgi:hypothetical protein